MNPKYIFVYRGGSSDVFTSTTEPTVKDIEGIKVGLLDVIRLSDLHLLDKEGNWLSLGKGAVTAVTIDGEERGPGSRAVPLG